jgi:hypothetical protein
MKKIVFIIVITFVLFTGCTHSNQNSVSNKNVSSGSFNSVSSENIVSGASKDNSQEQSNTTIASYNGEWHLIARARFIQGVVVALDNSADGKKILSLKVEVNYHSGTDPLDDKNSPFIIGQVVKFVLKNKPQIDISKNERVIIYQAQITTNGKDNFLGADIKYYENKGKFFDINGKEIYLPPQDYPSGI